MLVRLKAGAGIGVAGVVSLCGSVVLAQMAEPKIVDAPMRRMYNYGPVPENLAPAMPEELSNERGWIVVNMEKKAVGSLITMELTKVGRWNLVRRESDFDGQPQIAERLREDLIEAWKAGGQVLSCKYITGRPGEVWNYRFWYKTRPQLANPARLEGRISDHPMNIIGKPLHACPPTESEAALEKRSS